MGEIIKVAVRNRIAAADKNNPVYICGNSDFTVEFEFDADWSAHEHKTARFSYNGTYQDVVFSGRNCSVPIISDTHSFKVGVFAGNLKTTTAAYVSAKKSILCEGGLPDDPPPDVYAQIMEVLKTGASDEQIEAAVNKYLEENPIDTGVNFEVDETLRLEDGILSVNTTDQMEADNTQPITSAGVYTQVGNINALLATI